MKLTKQPFGKTGKEIINTAHNIFKSERFEKPDPDLPTFSTDPVKWMEEARPIVDGQDRHLDWLPFWRDIYTDQHSDVMILAGRQVFKTTYCADIIVYTATTKPSSQVCYVTHDEDALNVFSNQRLRVGTFEDNPMTLGKFPRFGTGNVGEVALKNKSTIYNKTDHDGYKHVEGTANQLVVLDEAQYQEVEFMAKLEQSLMTTHGKLRILGIGGEAGSAYERLWMRTDQREWEFDDEFWREKLMYDEDGFVWGDYLKDILKGRWVSKTPQHTEYHGYWLPQTMFPHIPLSIEDAKLLYKIAPKFSVEYHRLHDPQSIFTTHVMGDFHKARRRPITREMVLSCMEPYRNLHLLSAKEVIDLKTKHGNDITVAMGIDWGSGPSASLTAVCILVHWVKANRFQIAWLERRPQENQLDQTSYMIDLYKSYNCDIGIADLGYGQIQVRQMQDEITEGFFGCSSTSAEAKPFQFHETVTDEHGETVSRITIDKTAAIQEFIDMVERRMQKDDDPKSMVTQFMIPWEKEYETEFLINDMTAITRKDLAPIEDIEVTDKRSRPRKEFNHPKDTVMAIIYARQGAGYFNDSKWTWISA